MKIISRIVFTLGMLAALATGVFAQETLTANVPFSFEVNHKTMRPGMYTFRRLEAFDQRALAIQGEGQGAVVLSNPVDETYSSPKLIFLHVGDEYLLTRIVGTNLQYEIPTAAEQKEALAKNATVSEVMASAGK